MSFLGSLLSQKKSTGARLLERLASATQLDDRREAISEFKELSTKQPMRLMDQGGMSVIIDLLREEDTKLTRDALETLSNLMDPDIPREEPEAARVAAIHNAGVLLLHPSNLSYVTVAVDYSDMYVKFHCIQLLTRLLTVAHGKTQDAILSEPVSVGRILQLLDDPREIIRNEVWAGFTRWDVHVRIGVFSQHFSPPSVLDVAALPGLLTLCRSCCS